MKFTKKFENELDRFEKLILIYPILYIFFVQFIVWVAGYFWFLHLKWYGIAVKLYNYIWYTLNNQF